MLYIGPHLSIAKGFDVAVSNARSIDANTFQFFTRNPRGGRAREWREEEISVLKEAVHSGFGPVLAHAPYTLNMASKGESTLEFAEMAFREDLERLETIPCDFYNFHPGSHVGQGVAKGIEKILKILNTVMWKEQSTLVLLETMSGKGSEIGSRFEELAKIIEGADCAQYLGVCLDTCHIYSAGYDIVEDLDGVLETFDRVVGIHRLKAIHLNDSMMPFNSKKDRHAPLGKGTIGWETFYKIIHHPQLKDLPFYLETPHEELEGYGEEIAVLRKASCG